MDTAANDERCRCACGASWSTEAWNDLRPSGLWTTDEGVLELRICTCGSAISAPFTHASSELAVAAPADAPILFEIGSDRFQAWCMCMRRSPPICGPVECVFRTLFVLGWKHDGEAWTCPVCTHRAEAHGERP